MDPSFRALCPMDTTINPTQDSKVARLICITKTSLHLELSNILVVYPPKSKFFFINSGKILLLVKWHDLIWVVDHLQLSFLPKKQQSEHSSWEAALQSALLACEFS